MNLLLLLSALLSALTGVGGSVRAPDVAQAVAGRQAVETAVAERRQRVAARPVPALPTLVAQSAAGVANRFAIVPGEPLWAGRRRE